MATSNKPNIVISGVHPLGLSDHYLVHCIRKFRGSLKKQHKNISTRSLKNLKKTEFLNDLLSVDWKGIVSNTHDINTTVEQWSQLFSLILEKNAPIRNKRVSEGVSPWLTKDFHTMSATRDSGGFRGVDGGNCPLFTMKIQIWRPFLARIAPLFLTQMRSLFSLSF